MAKSISLDKYLDKQLKNPEFKEEYEKLGKKYNVVITFVDGKKIETTTYGTNKKIAKMRVMLERQRIGDEMFVRSVKISLNKENTWKL